MVIIRLSGGLGNQMFEYALYLSLKAQGKTVKIDDVSDYRAADRRPMQLGLFAGTYERASQEEIIRFTDSSMTLTQRIRRKLTGRRSLAWREKSMEYDPEVMELDNVYLEGFFQSEKYFASVKEEVRRALQFRGPEPGGAGSGNVGAGNVSGTDSSSEAAAVLRPSPAFCLSPAYQDILSRICSSRSVSIHVRRGDYLDASHNGIYEGICTCDYYERAISLIEREIPQAEFFLFTNDVEWTKEHLSGERRTVVEGGSEETGYLDLYLMSRCEHNIIANSSFSWWGAWLNPNPDKKVIAPSRWLNGRECRDIYTEEMIRI